MSVGNRAATCTSCGKRLNRKQWYYRNGKYFCKKRCWGKEQEKVAKEAAKEETQEGPKKEEAAKAKKEASTAS